MPGPLQLAHVAADYAHYPKRAEFRAMLRPGAAELKYYHLASLAEPVPPAVDEAARAFVAAEAGALGLGDDRGILILHRCGVDFHFLLLAVWRGTNELWEAVYYNDLGMGGFAAFGPAYGAPLRPTFCVWELGIVAQESRAWTRFLASPRGEEELERWRADVMKGDV